LPSTLPSRLSERARSGLGADVLRPAHDGGLLTFDLTLAEGHIKGDVKGDREGQKMTAKLDVTPVK